MTDELATLRTRVEELEAAAKHAVEAWRAAIEDPREPMRTLDSPEDQMKFIRLEKLLAGVGDFIVIDRLTRDHYRSTIDAQSDRISTLEAQVERLTKEPSEEMVEGAARSMADSFWPGPFQRPIPYDDLKPGEQSVLLLRARAALKAAFLRSRAEREG